MYLISSNKPFGMSYATHQVENNAACKRAPDTRS